MPTPASATAPALEIRVGPLDISLKDELLFIKSVLIPAFDPDNELDNSMKRKKWMRQKAIRTHWDAEVSAELIERYGTVNNLAKAEAKEKEVKAERLLEKAEENERKPGKSSIICSSSSFFNLLSICFQHACLFCLTWFSIVCCLNFICGLSS
jgi:hypothetical protein